MRAVNPFLRWAGSKKRLLPKLKSYWQPDCLGYVEPFMGSACLFFDLQPDRAILGDLNSDLVNTYMVIRDHYRAVHNALLRLPLGKNNYYKIRSVLPSSLLPTERAARFLYLNSFCFNGLYRTNQSGQFNVPFSASSGTLPSYEQLKAVSTALEMADILCGDFEKTLHKARRGDFVYLDPPFAVSNRRVFKEYLPKSFGSSDIDRLRSNLVSLDKAGIKFLVSYAYCKEAIDLASRWYLKRVFTQRNISGFAEHRRKAVELLISNFVPTENIDNATA